MMDYDRARKILESIPFVTADLPGVGGEIKAEPEHFQVTEVLPYEAEGEGEHVYITVQRKLWNTADVGRTLGKILKVKARDIGWGGMKDKHALTTQTFSLRLGMRAPLDEIRAKLEEKTEFTIVEINRHKNKIKTGHVRANKFRIILSNPSNRSLIDVQAIADRIVEEGLANFYGNQRFSGGFSNVRWGMEIVRSGEQVRGRKGTFIVSALQSALFNHWLSDRVTRGEFRRILSGDLMSKVDTGGVFIADDVDECENRFQRKAVSYTGPMFGFKMMEALQEAGEYESTVLKDWGFSLNDFRAHNAPGTRRVALLWMEQIQVSECDEGFIFEFELPSGAYATTVMREFTKAG